MTESEVRALIDGHMALIERADSVAVSVLEIRQITYRPKKPADVLDTDIDHHRVWGRYYTRSGNYDDFEYPTELLGATDEEIGRLTVEAMAHEQRQALLQAEEKALKEQAEKESYERARYAELKAKYG
jgi:hypothetical protein